MYLRSGEFELANAYGFLHDAFGPCLYHRVPETGILKFCHWDVLLEAGEKLHRFFDIPVCDDLAPMCLVRKLFEECPVVVEVVSI